jgi:hypothetical protein
MARIPIGPGLRRAALAACLCALLVPPAWANEEATLKAAIVFNLMLYAQWPAEPAAPATAPLVLCADANSKLWPHLRALQDRAVRQWKLSLRETPAGDVGKQCQALLVEDGASAALPARLGAGTPLLVVADTVRAEGAMVTLEMVAGRVVFDVDLAAARRAGMQISSKLLRLARSVRE